jgi:hypothetical protein
VGQTFCTNISATDANNDNIDLSLVGSTSNSNFVITTNGIGNAAGNFCFTPTALDAGRIFSFTINAIDNNCPIVLASSMTFNIVVPKPCSSLGLSSTITNASSCGFNNGAIALSSTSTVQPFSYYWSGSNGFSANTQNVSNLLSGSYSVIVVDGNNCSDKLNLDIINVNDTIVRDSTTQSDCNKIKFRGITYASNTTIIDTFRNTNGCDSALHYYVLSVIKPVTNFIVKVSCTGEKIIYNEKTYGVSTNFIETIKSAKGCDSIYNNVKIIIKTVVPIVQTTNLFSCNGKLTFNGTVYNSSRTLVDTIKTVEGCDSIYKQTNIIISSIKVQLQNITLTGCQIVIYKTIVYTKNAILKDTLKSVYGCDSIYLNVTISITQPVTPSVTILNRGSDKICKGATFSLKAFVTNGGTNPTYQWTVNGVPVAGANAVYFITNNLNNNDTVRCIISSSLLCITTATATSNFIIVKIVEPVYRTTNLKGCNKVIYNGVSYTDNTTLNDTTRTNIGCDSIINTVNIMINNITATTLTITMVACNSIVYNGTTYIASTTLRDTIRNAQGCDSFYIVKILNVVRVTAATNIVSQAGCGRVVFNGRTYTSSTVLNDTLRSLAGCDSVYNITNITVNPAVIPTIVVTPSQNPVCVNSNVIFTATITNGGTNPQYQWYKNGVLIPGATSATYNYAGSPDSNTIYTCRLTSNALCAEPSNVISNSLRLNYIGTAIASISITANQTTICSTATVIFTAIAINGGTNPQYQWKKNGVNIAGANSATYSTANIASNDVFTCALTSNSQCVSSTNVLSNGITIIVNASSLTIVNHSVLGGVFIAPLAMQVNTTAPISTTLPAGGTWFIGQGTFNNGIISFSSIIPGGNLIGYQFTDQNSKCATRHNGYIYVYNLPTPLTGNSIVCNIGSTTTLSTNAYNNGFWSSSNPSVATVTATSSNGHNRIATITAMGSGSTVISFSMAPLGYPTPVSTTVTVAPVTVAPIIGNSSICIGATTQLTNATPNGVWSSVAGRAITNATGLVTGTSAGVAEIRYTVNNAATGCSAYAVKNVTVNATPNVPTITYAPTTLNPQLGAGTGQFCLNRTFDVVGTPIGGVWTSSNNSAMTVTRLGTIATIGLGTATLTYTVTNNGCSNSRSMSGTVVGCAAKGVSISNEQLTIINDFIMYPNPAKSFINLNVETLVGVGSIIITDLYGKTLKTQSLSMGTNTVNISNLSKGMYFVSTITNEGKNTKKLLVE